MEKGNSDFPNTSWWVGVDDIVNDEGMCPSNIEGENLRVTKIYFPMITLVKLEEVDMEPLYFTSIPGGPIHPSTDVVISEEDWRRTLWEAKKKGSKVETKEI